MRTETALQNSHHQTSRQFLPIDVHWLPVICPKICLSGSKVIWEGCISHLGGQGQGYNLTLYSKVRPEPLVRPTAGPAGSDLSATALPLCASHTPSDKQEGASHGSNSWLGRQAVLCSKEQHPAPLAIIWSSCLTCRFRDRKDLGRTTRCGPGRSHFKWALKDTLGVRYTRRLPTQEPRTKETGGARTKKIPTRPPQNRKCNEENGIKRVSKASG